MPSASSNFDSESYRELMRRVCRDSFWQFVLFAFGAEDNPKGKRWLDPLIHKPLCDWFQEKILAWTEARKDGKGYPLYLMVLVPRDVGKTTIISRAGLLWTHLLDPDISTYIGSQRTEFAVDILEPIKSVMDGSDGYAKFSWLYGNWYNPDRSWSQKQVVHAARKNLSRLEPSFGTWGVEAGVTGKHPDILCLDDPTSYEKIASAGNWLQVVNEHCESLIPVLQSDGCIIYPGTRYHDGDHFGRAIDRGGIKSVSGMPMPRVVIDPKGKWDAYFLSARTLAGVPSIPSVWPEDRLRHFKNEAPLKYSAQVLNDPLDSEYNNLPMERLKECIVEEKDLPKNLRITFHVDTAFKSKKQEARGDATAIVEMGHSQDGTGTVYFLGAHGDNTLNAESFRDLLLSRYMYWKGRGKKVHIITDEAVIGKDNMAELLFRTWFLGINQPCPMLVTLNRFNKRKELRHIEAAQFVLDGKVFFLKDSKNLASLLDQLSKIGLSPHDDFVDGFSDAFHPACYTIMHRMAYKPEDEEIRSPWDDYLKQPPEQYLQRDLDRLGL